MSFWLLIATKILETIGKVCIKINYQRKIFKMEKDSVLERTAKKCN